MSGISTDIGAICALLSTSYSHSPVPEFLELLLYFFPKFEAFVRGCSGDIGVSKEDLVSFGVGIWVGGLSGCVPDKGGVWGEG